MFRGARVGGGWCRLAILCADLRFPRGLGGMVAADDAEAHRESAPRRDLDTVSMTCALSLQTDADSLFLDANGTSAVCPLRWPV